MQNLKKRHQEIIRDNYNAFINNFEKPFIVYGEDEKSYYVFHNEEEYKSGSYVQYCYNIDYLNGWLYGAVQAINKQLRIDKMEVIK